MEYIPSGFSTHDLVGRLVVVVRDGVTCTVVIGVVVLIGIVDGLTI